MYFFLFSAEPSSPVFGHRTSQSRTEEQLGSQTEISLVKPDPPVPDARILADSPMFQISTPSGDIRPSISENKYLLTQIGSDRIPPLKKIQDDLLPRRDRIIGDLNAFPDPSSGNYSLTPPLSPKLLSSSPPFKKRFLDFGGININLLNIHNPTTIMTCCLCTSLIFNKALIRSDLSTIIMRQ